MEKLDNNDCIFDDIRSVKSRASSSRSRASTRSSGSQLSIRIALKHAEAEAAKVKMEYSEKEAMLQRKKADLEIDLQLLQDRKDVAVAQAEVDALENSQRITSESLQQLPRSNTQTRTSEFVANQSTSIPMPLLNPETPTFITKNDQHGVTAYNQRNYPTVFPTQRTISHMNETQCLTDCTKFFLKRIYCFQD